MRGVNTSLKLTAAVMVTVMLLTDYQIVQGESQYKPVEFEPIEAAAKTQQKEAEPLQDGLSPFYRTHDVQAYTNEEIDLLKKVATAEAGNQGEDGMWMVMSVVINRTKGDLWPDTITGVIQEAHQFTSVSNGTMQRTTDYTEECEGALQRILSGDVAPQIIAFEAIDNNTLDEYFWPAFTYGDHIFCTKK